MALSAAELDVLITDLTNQYTQLSREYSETADNERKEDMADTLGARINGTCWERRCVWQAGFCYCLHRMRVDLTVQNRGLDLYRLMGQGGPQFSLCMPHDLPCPL
jgi:hypothetical protein